MSVEWNTAPLASVCQIKPPKREVRQELGGSDLVSFVPMNDLGERRKELDLNDVKPLQDVIGSYTYFADGDVLLAKITPCFENGKLGIANGLVNGVGFGSSEFIVFRPGEELDAEFLFYFLSQDRFRDAGAKVMTGAVGHKRVAKEFIESYRIPLPPIKEQKRIVAILDEAFDGIAAATANTEKNLVSARELFDSTSRDLFSRNKDWKRFLLSELLEKQWVLGHLDGNHGADYPRKSEFVTFGIPYISANCIVHNEVDLTSAKFLSAERASKLKKGFARNGDVLFAHNATVGPVSILKTDEPFVVLSTSLTYYRCNTDFILPNYLAHYMRTPIFSDQYKAVMRQSTRNQVPITKQRTFFHVVPPLSDQQRIASVLDKLESEVVRLEWLCRRKVSILAELKQSLLQKAFTGQLTAADADQTRHSAAVLAD